MVTYGERPANLGEEIVEPNFETIIHSKGEIYHESN